VFENMVFEDRMLRTILRSKRKDVTGEWRKPRNEELHNLYCLTTIVRLMK
jgi:hypothetical protein